MLIVVSSALPKNRVYHLFHPDIGKKRLAKQGVQRQRDRISTFSFGGEENLTRAQKEH